jgi:hypothetical protein
MTSKSGAQSSPRSCIISQRCLLHMMPLRRWWSPRLWDRPVIQCERDFDWSSEHLLHEVRTLIHVQTMMARLQSLHQQGKLMPHQPWHHEIIDQVTPDLLTYLSAEIIDKPVKLTLFPLLHQGLRQL